MFDKPERSLTVAGSIDEALAACRQGAAILAGGTWLMRDPRRGRPIADALVTLHKIPGFTDVRIGSDSISVGAAVTHEALGRLLIDTAGFEAIVAAAMGAANPAIRRVATVGGNLCTQDFAAADLLPALLAAGAIVELQGSEGPLLLPIGTFLKDRKTLLGDTILSRVILDRTIAASAHARLPLRKAGDYPVAIVSMAVDTNGRMSVAVGSVENVARRWNSLENAFAARPGGRPASAEEAAELAGDCNDFHGRDGTEANGWYRRQVMPALVRRSMAALFTAGVAA